MAHWLSFPTGPNSLSAIEKTTARGPARFAMNQEKLEIAKKGVRNLLLAQGAGKRGQEPFFRGGALANHLDL